MMYSKVAEEYKNKGYITEFRETNKERCYLVGLVKVGSYCRS